MQKLIPAFLNIIAVLSTIIVFLFFACSFNESKTANNLINSGLEDYQNGDLSSGISKFSKAIEIQPQNYYAYLNRGLCYRDLNDHKNAITDFEKCIELEPQKAEAYFELGFFSSYRGDIKEAIQYYSKSIELDKTFSRAYGTLGIMNAMLGNYDKADEILSLGISMDLNEPMLYIVRAQVFEKEGRCSDSINDFEKGMSFDPEQFDTKINIAWILATCPDDGIRDGQKALALLKNHPEIEKDKTGFKALAAAFAELGDFEKAIDYQKKAIAKVKKIEISGKMEEQYYKNELENNYHQLKLYEQKRPWRIKVP